MWGLVPLFWPLLKPAGAVEILAHRMVWSLVFVAAALAVVRRWAWIGELVRQPRRLALITVAAAVITVNWGVYIWSVNSGHVVEASLGYFINPLVTIAIGVLLLKERLRPVQWAAVGIGALAVVVLTVGYGRPPWISLCLAFSFATYGLVKKKVNLGGVESLAAETAIQFLPALGYLVWLGAQGESTFGAEGAGHALLLAATGIVTALPWSASAPRRSACRCPRWGCCSTWRRSSSSCSASSTSRRPCRRSAGPGSPWCGWRSPCSPGTPCAPPAAPPARCPAVAPVRATRPCRRAPEGRAGRRAAERGGGGQGAGDQALARGRDGVVGAVPYNGAHDADTYAGHAGALEGRRRRGRPHAQADFWAAALHYVVEDNSPLIEKLLAAGAVPEALTVESHGRRAWRDLAAVRHPDDPYEEESGTGRGRRLLFQRVPEEKTVKNRLHLDLHPGVDRRDEESARLEGLGARVLRRVEEPSGSWVVMADPEGNEFCLH